MTIIKNQKFILILFLISLTFLVGNVFAEGTVNFNVYQDSGRDYNLTGITVDCNGTDYDLTNQTSPFSINFTTTGPHTCIFSKSEWDGNTINITADTNKTMNVYLDKFIYPKIYAFYATTATTSSTTPVAVQTWSYNANFGGTTSASVACVLWASSGATTFTGTWNIDSSDDGITWTTRGTTTRSMESNTVAANPFIESPSYNISDGTRYLRLTHSSSSASGVLTTNNVSCHLRTNRDQNNFLITTTSNSVPQTNINSTVYANLGTPFTLTAPFNGLLYTVGSTIYNKANGFTSSETAIRALKNTIAYAEYPRYVTSNTSGTGGLAELLKDINSAQTITIQYQGKSTTSQARFTITANNYFLNQKVGEFEQTLLTGKTNNTRD